MYSFNSIYSLLLLFKPILLQLKVEGLDEAAQQGILFKFLVGIIVILGGVIGTLWWEIKRSSRKIDKLQEEHFKTNNLQQDNCKNAIEAVRNEYTKLLEDRHQEFNKKEEERNRQFLENEKETLKALNGVTSILSVTEKMTDANNAQVMEKLESMEKIILTRINNIGNYEA